MLVKLPQCKIKSKPISLQTTEYMVGIEILILYICQLTLQLSQVLSGLPNFVPVSTGVMFREAVDLIHWISVPPHHVSFAHPHRSSSVASTSFAVEAAEVLRAPTMACTMPSFS
jgi:hypothetical protein